MNYEFPYEECFYQGALNALPVQELDFLAALETFRRSVLGLSLTQKQRECLTAQTIGKDRGTWALSQFQRVSQEIARHKIACPFRQAGGRLIIEAQGWSLPVDFVAAKSNVYLGSK